MIERDAEATAEFQRVARAVKDALERKDGSLSRAVAVHVLGVSDETLAEMGLADAPDLLTDQ